MSETNASSSLQPREGAGSPERIGEIDYDALRLQRIGAKVAAIDPRTEESDLQFLYRRLMRAEAALREAATAPAIDVRPDVGVYCAHCSHAIAVCPECGKAEWRKGDPKDEANV